jgi:hypothetical protein
MTAAIIINIVFAAGIVGTIIGALLWSVATQHRDHGVLAAGPLVRRHLWSGIPHPRAAPARPRLATRRPQVA